MGRTGTLRNRALGVGYLMGNRVRFPKKIETIYFGEVIALPILAGSTEYLAWIDTETSP